MTSVGINLKDRVYGLIGPRKGEVAIVRSIEFNAGAANGWFTVLYPDGTEGLFAGEEIRIYTEEGK